MSNPFANGIAIVSDNNDATLEELRILLKQNTGVRIGRSTLDRMLNLLNLQLKKHYTQHKKRVNEFNYSGGSSGRQYKEF